MNNRFMMIALVLTCVLGALAAQSLSDASELKGLQLKPNGANGVNVLLDVDAPTAYKMTRSANGSTELILPNTQLPEAFQKTGLPGITDSASGVNATVTQRSGDVKIQLTPASSSTQQKSIQVTLSGAKPITNKPLDPGLVTEEKTSPTQAARPKHKAATALGDKPAADRPLVEQLFRQLQATVKPPSKPAVSANKNGQVIPAAATAKATMASGPKTQKKSPRLNLFKPLVATASPPVAKTVPVDAPPKATGPVRGWGAGSAQSPSKLYTIPGAPSAAVTPVEKMATQVEVTAPPDRAAMGLDAASQNRDLLNTPDVSDILNEDDLIDAPAKTIKGYPPIEPEGLPDNAKVDYEKAPELKDWPWLSWLTSAGIMILGLSMLGLAFLIFRIRRAAPVRPIGLGYNDPRRLSHYEMDAAAEAHRASRYTSEYLDDAPLPKLAQQRRSVVSRNPRMTAPAEYQTEYRERAFEPDDMPPMPQSRRTTPQAEPSGGVYPHRDQGVMPRPMVSDYYDEVPQMTTRQAPPPPRPAQPRIPKPPAVKPPMYRDELYPDLDLPSSLPRPDYRPESAQHWVEPDMDEVVEQVIADWQANQSSGDPMKSTKPLAASKKPFGLGLSLFKKQQATPNPLMSHPNIDAPLISSSRKQAAYSSYEDRSRGKLPKPRSFQVDDEALDQLYTQDVGFEPDWIPERPVKTKTRLDKPKAIQRRSLLETSAIRHAAEQDPYFDDVASDVIRPSYAPRDMASPPPTQQRRAIRYSPRR